MSDFRSYSSALLEAATHTDQNIYNHPDILAPSVDGVPRKRGRIPRDWTRHPYGSIGIPFEDSGIELIPPSDWKDWCKKIAEEKRTAMDLVNRLKQPCLDQDGESYCWTYACVGALELTRAEQGLAYIQFAPECVAATIKKGRNEGGYGPDAMEFMRDRGICSMDLWPHLDRNYRKYDTQEVWDDAARTKVTFVELRPRDIHQQVSALFQRYKCPVGLNYWGHEVYDTDVAWIGESADPLKNIAIDFRNSWTSSYGDNGFGRRTGNQRYADDICAVFSVTASN